MKHLALICVVATLPMAVSAAQSARPVRGLTPFESDRALRSYFAPLNAEYRRVQQERYRLALESQKAQAAVCNRKAAPVRGSTGDSTAIISGIVRDVSTQPVTSATIAIQSLGLATSTGADGKYRLAIPSDSLPSARQVVMRTLRIGFAARHDTLTIARGESIDFDILLCGVSMSLENVVVTGAASIASMAKDESITNTQHEGVD